MTLLSQYPKWRTCVILISLGAVTLFYGITDLMRDCKSQHWPSVSGVIRSSSMIKTIHWPSDIYSANVSYDYQIAGVSYSGSRMSFGGFWVDSNSEKTMAILNRYPQGKVVTFFHDPANPQVAVLETGITDRAWTTLAFSIFFLLWGILPIGFLLNRARYGKIASHLTAKNI